MRAFYFMKIDCILTKKQLYIVPIFFLIALVVSKSAEAGEMSLLMACSYLMFISGIFSTTPFAYCGGKNRGFLLLFPATVRDRVTGRFLYGLSFVGLLGLLCAVLLGASMLFGGTIPHWTLGVLLCELAIVIVLTALEFLFFYLFGEGKDNWQTLSNIVRVAPGMALFFASNYAIGAVEEAAASDMGMKLGLEAMSKWIMQVGALAIAVALLLTVAAVAVCVKVIEKRDYA